jgi:membrane-associated phospholipid phosphatase
MATGEIKPPDLDPVAERLARRIGGRIGGQRDDGAHGQSGGLTGAIVSARHRLADVLRQAGAVDRAVYETIAKVPTPALDVAMRRLSNSANNSLLWIAIAAGLSLTGASGRRAAGRGVLAIGITSALVNVGVKPFYTRTRPDREAAGVPGERYVTMPASTSFPSGHSASAFAFATAVSRDNPWLAIAIQFLAGGVAYSRVHTGVHYPGDTIAGALIGAGTGQAVSSILDRTRASRAQGAQGARGARNARDARGAR